MTYGVKVNGVLGNTVGSRAVANSIAAYEERSRLRWAPGRAVSHPTTMPSKVEVVRLD